MLLSQLLFEDNYRQKPGPGDPLFSRERTEEGHARDGAGTRPEAPPDGFTQTHAHGNKRVTHTSVDISHIAPCDLT